MKSEIRKTVPVLLLALMCSYAPAQTPDATERQAIEAAAASFSAAYMRGDMDAMMDSYANDAVIMPGGRDIISHRDSIRRYWTLPPGRTVTHHKSTPVEITIVDSTAYDYGYYEGASAQNDKPPVSWGGKYVIVWVKGDDGMWRMKVDVWNTRK